MTIEKGARVAAAGGFGLATADGDDKHPADVAIAASRATSAAVGPVAWFGLVAGRSPARTARLGVARPATAAVRACAAGGPR